MAGNNMRGLRLSFVVLFFFVLACVSARPDPPATKPAKQPGHQVVRVTGPEARGAVEVAVAINPMHIEQIIATSNQGPPVGQPPCVHMYVSNDGGLTWKDVAGANPERRPQGDAAITYGADGVAYRTYISLVGFRGARPARAATGIFLSSSRDGLTWTDPTPVVDHVNSVEPLEDKPWPAVDPFDDSPQRGNVYVSWTRFDVYGSKDPAHKTHVYFSRSKDGGKTFSPGRRISDKPGDCTDSSTTVMGAMPVVGPKGEVYVVWAGPDGNVFSKSTDGGFTFGKEKVLTKTPGGWNIPAPGMMRHDGLPVVGLDRSGGPNRGSIYVNWIDKRHGDCDVFLMSSRDGGETWSEPLRVNDDSKGNGKDQLFTWMAVDPADGAINVFYYDRRDLNDTLTTLTLARSVDGGKTFVNHKVRQEPFECHRDVFFGDYIGVAAQAGRVVGLYSHFTGRRSVALSAALFRFRLGSQELVEGD